MSNLDKIVEDLSSLTILEAAELTKILEEKWGVSAAAPVAVAAAPADEPGTAKGAEKTSYSIVIVSAGQQKLQVVKVVKDLLGLGLKEAKSAVDASPEPIKKDVPKAEAEDIKAKLEAVGATVELK